MATVIKCDICGNEFTNRFLNGKYMVFDFKIGKRSIRFLNSEKVEFDVCSKCMEKIARLSIDKEMADYAVDDCVKNIPDEYLNNDELCAAYCTGHADALKFLSTCKIKKL